MKPRPLNDTEARAAKAPPGKRKILKDPTCPGLQLRVTDKGAKTFSFVYKLHGKTKRLHLGDYDPPHGLSLADAREATNDARKLVRQQVDPAAQRAVKLEAAREEANGMTFEELCVEYLDKYAKVEKGSWENDVSLLKRPRAKWGKKLARSITDEDVAKMLTEILDEGYKTTANRLRSVLRKMYEWARDKGRRAATGVTVNPVADVNRFTPNKPRKRFLAEAEVRTLWRGIERGLRDGDLPCEPEAALACLLVLVSIRRPHEVAGLERDELANLHKPGRAEIVLPPDRVKKDDDFVGPINDLAVEIINRAMTDPEQPVVFASRFSDRASIARRTLSQALTGKKGDKKRPGLRKWLGMKHFTTHDLRRTGATWARAGGAPRDHVKHLLGHTPDDVTGVYDQYDMYREKRLAAFILEIKIREIVGLPPNPRLVLLAQKLEEMNNLYALPEAKPELRIVA